ncbi:hypothetical protein C8F01DRAFT_997919 [Mycena amicta]|nr:hypothetical protein C8F01DRAFT_997919 [Mycena amicta]
MAIALHYINANPRAVTLAAIIAVGTPMVIDNYRRYVALGESQLTKFGLFGWLTTVALTGLGRETLSTAEYGEKVQGCIDAGEMVERRGSRPQTGWHSAPHRQIDRLPSEEMAKRLEEMFAKHVAANPKLVQLVESSPHEQLHPGMVIHPDIATPHRDAEWAVREIAHIHPTDHSMHLVLSPADSKVAIELGWAERHPLSGVFKMFPLPGTYLLVYAPRDDEELEIVERLLIASIKYMTGSGEVA